MRTQGDDDTVFTDAAAAFRSLQLGGAGAAAGELSSSSSSDEDEPDEALAKAAPDELPVRWAPQATRGLLGPQVEEEDAVMMDEDAGGGHPGVAGQVGSQLVPMHNKRQCLLPRRHAALGAWPACLVQSGVQAAHPS